MSDLATSAPDAALHRPTHPATRSSGRGPRSRANRGPAGAPSSRGAYGLVAAKRPELRWSYIPLPWAYFYEHPYSIA